MRAGLPISLALHAGVIGLGMFAMGETKPLEAGKVIPVEMITVDEFSDIRASLKAEKPIPPKVDPEPEPMQVETSAPNAPEEGDLNLAPDEVTDAKPQEPAIDSLAQAEADIIPKEEPKTEPTFDLDRLSSLIDKARETAPDANTQVATQAERDRLVYADKAREGVGLGQRMTLSELDALQSAMYRCWRMPADAVDLEKLIVRLQVDMLPGGHVAQVDVIDRARSRAAAPGNPFWDVAERRAVQAVSKCAPYDFLPPEKYDQWQSLILNFRPQT